MMSDALIPEIGNLAWAPLSALDEVELFDRYNGVPTLGMVRIGAQRHLFWRVLGYTGDFALWLYVPLTPEDLESLDDDEGPGVLDGIAFRSPRPRFVTLGVAHRHRLIFEREWSLPPGLGQHEILGPIANFAAEALTIGVERALPSSRRHLVEQAKEAVRHLSPC